MERDRLIKVIVWTALLALALMSATLVVGGDARAVVAVGVAWQVTMWAVVQVWVRE